MRASEAIKLHPHDEVWVRLSGDWIPGYVVSYPSKSKDGVFVDVQTHTEGFLADIRHTDLR